MSRMNLALACICLALTACGTPNDETPEADVANDQAAEDLPGFCMNGACEAAADCGDPGGCVSTVACAAGCCEYTYVVEGTPCDEGCTVGGACSVSGACIGGTELVCADEDGNPCTVAACDPDTGSCVETALADGEGVVTSHCWEGIVCSGGAPDMTDATATVLAQDCEAQDEALDPYGCVDEVICVDSEEACVELLADDGDQCWGDVEGQSDGTTCVGQSCQAGACQIDHGLDQECGEDAYPADCDLDCQVCTTLSCHWIDDPAKPDSSTKMVRYCRPEATVTEACDDGNGCTIDDACVLDQTGDGPLGKETLGLCTPGEGKTKDECLAEMELPALPCLKAGISCDSEAGCALDQDAADAWCMPPSPVCVDGGGTFCTHVDLGDGKWNAETGCHMVLFDDDCSDGNPCTEDLCDTDTGCQHYPKENGTPCGEDLVCQDGDCVDVCTPDCAGKLCGGDGCGGSCGTCDDDNVCTLDICVDGGQCTFPAGSEGGACDGPDICDGECQAGVCVDTAVEVCNGQDDDCDALVDEGDLCPAGSICDGGMCKEDCTPLDGGWTGWSCGACSEPCGGGVQICTRSCTNPPPSCGGAQCVGPASQQESCNVEVCSNELPTGTTALEICENVTVGEVPAGKTSILLKLWGAGGGGGAPGGGGGGAFVQGTLAVQPGDELELRIGCGGENENGGGGASYVLKNGEPVMIAAGGGGGGSDGCSGCHQNTSPDTAQGGAGGPVGGNGQAGYADNTYGMVVTGGQGGTQSAGGVGGTAYDPTQYSGCLIDGFVGSAHTGGENTLANCGTGAAASWHEGGSNGGGNGSGGGGGAGWYGGGGGAAKYTYNGGGGGGGSSWVAASVSSVSSEGGFDRNPGGTGTPGYQEGAGLGGKGQTDPFEDHLDATDGNDGLIIIVL